MPYFRSYGTCAKDIDYADAFVDDVIIGSTGNNLNDLLHNHNRDLRKVLHTLKKAGLVADPDKAQLFVQEVGFYWTHPQRWPDGKLLPNKDWILPKTLI